MRGKRIKLQKRLSAIFLSVAMIVFAIPNIGMNGGVHAAAIEGSIVIRVAPPVAGKYPVQNEYEQYSVIEPDNCKVYDYNKDGFAHGIKWTKPASSEKVGASEKFASKKYYFVHVIVGGTNYYDTLPDNKYNYFASVRGAAIEDSSVVRVENISGTNLKEAVFKVEACPEWTELSYNITKPMAGKNPSKSVTVKGQVPGEAFNETYIESIDISDTWYVSDTGAEGTYKKMSATAEFVQNKYYRTSAPEKIKKTLVDNFYDYKTWNRGWQAVRQKAYGISDSVKFTVNGITFTGLKPDKWNTEKNGAGEYIDKDGCFCFGITTSKVGHVSIEGFEYPINNAHPGYGISVEDNTAYKLENINGRPIVWYNETYGYEMNEDDRFYVGIDYKAVIRVSAKENAYFDAGVNKVYYSLNGTFTWKTSTNSTNELAEFEIHYHCPDIDERDAVTISGVEGAFEGKGSDLNTSTDKWVYKKNSKYDISFPRWYSSDGYVKDDDIITVGKKYRLIFNVVAKDGKTFSSELSEIDKLNFIVEGADSTYIEGYNSIQNMVYVSAVFTCKPTLKNIKVNGSVKPSSGDKNYYDGFKSDDPSTYSLYDIDSSFMKNGITWSIKKGANYVPVEVGTPITFEKDKEYAITAHVKAAEGQKLSTDISQIEATIGGIKAEVNESEGGGCYDVTVYVKAKDPITEFKYTITEPVIGEKPGVITFDTTPSDALTIDKKFDSSSYWQVSSDGKTYESMNKDSKFEEGKYYRTNAYAYHQLAFVISSLFGNVYNNEVTYGLSDKYTILINGKSTKEEGVIVDGYVVFGPLTEKKADNSKTDDTKTDDKKQDSTTTKPGDKTTTSPNKTDGKTIDGVGTISKDGKTLTDSDGVKYKVSDKITKAQLKKNTKIADKKSGGKYRITKITKKNGKVVGGTVEYMAPYNKNAKLISATGKVKLAGVIFTVTSIAQNCGKGCKNLTKLVVGENVTNIGKNAFSGCSKLKKINIKTKKLKKVGANAFKGINKKATISVPKAKKKAYTKLLKGKGQAKTVKIK